MNVYVDEIKNIPFPIDMMKFEVNYYLADCKNINDIEALLNDVEFKNRINLAYLEDKASSVRGDYYDKYPTLFWKDEIDFCDIKLKDTSFWGVFYAIYDMFEYNGIPFSAKLSEKFYNHFIHIEAKDIIYEG